MNTKMLLITNELSSSSMSGRKTLCYLNYLCLKEIYLENLLVFELIQKPINNINSIFNAIAGRIDGVNNKTIQQVLEILKLKNVKNVFIDGSNLGGLTQVIKKEFPKINIIVFFHNIESRFFFGSFKHKKTINSFGVLLANYFAEKKSVKFADEIICLSKHDDKILRKIYGRSANHLTPLSMKDKFPVDYLKYKNDSIEKFALFVGGNFYANQQGIKWFIKFVVPNINIKIIIIGNGFEKIKKELEINNKVKVLGPVESIDKWYLNSHFVIAPIFDGSGMNTKVAEALMFGKIVVGTSKAFSGYNNLNKDVALVCDKASDFIDKINELDNMSIEKFNKLSRSIFENKYSYKAAVKRLKKICIKNG